MKKIVDTKQSMGKTMRESAFALTEAKYAAGEFRHTVFDSVETVGYPKIAIDLAFMHKISCKCSAVLLYFPHDCPCYKKYVTCQLICPKPGVLRV